MSHCCKQIKYQDYILQWKFRWWEITKRLILQVGQGERDVDSPSSFFFLYINSYIELYKILRAKACSDHYWSSLSLTLHAESSPASVGTPGREAVQNTKQRSAAQRRVLQWGHRRILQRWKTELWKLGHTVWFLACAGGIQQKPKELKWVHNQKLELWVGKINNKKKKGWGAQFYKMVITSQKQLPPEQVTTPF